MHLWCTSINQGVFPPPSLIFGVVNVGCLLVVCARRCFLRMGCPNIHPRMGCTRRCRNWRPGLHDSKVARPFPHDCGRGLRIRRLKIKAGVAELVDALTTWNLWKRDEADKGTRKRNVAAAVAHSPLEVRLLPSVPI